MLEPMVSSACVSASGSCSFTDRTLASICYTRNPSHTLTLQGGVTPIDSIVTAATAVGQWSTVKAAQTGAVNGQSGSKVQSKTRATLFMATCRQVLQGQIADRSKVNGQKSAWSMVKTPKTAVKALTRGRSCDYSVYGSDPPLALVCRR